MSHLTAKERTILSILLLVIGTVIFIDSIGDLRAGDGWLHAGTELTAVGALFATLLWLWVQKAGEMSRAVAFAGERHEALLKEAESWRSQVAPIKPDLRSAIETQFSAWSLTPAEQEISMLILKGLSNKEIAAVRSASEMTIKQQANSIYRKSGIANRSQLLAFFLEDLF
jgi:DNA-binding CsgD family transcriptional regulator